MATPTRVESPTAEELAARATAMIPTLLERAPEAEELRRVPPATVAEIKAAHLARTLRPAHYGGYQKDYRTFATIVRELGRGCASTAWCASSWMSQAFTLDRYPEAAQDEVGPGPRLAFQILEVEGAELWRSRRPSCSRLCS